MAGELTCNDKMCAAYVEQADGSVCLQVQVKDPAATEPKIDTEIQLLCDTGNGDAKFYAAVQYTDAGDFEVIAPIDLDGNPYTVVGPVEICAVEDAKIVVTEACDELADGSRVRFYYMHTVQAGSIISSIAIGANGGAYTPNNEIPETKGEFADDIEVTTVQLCDTGNNNEPYLLHTYHNTTTGDVTPVTTELDGSTAYTPIEEGAYKPTRCFMTEVYIINKVGLVQGGTERYWEASAVNPGALVSIAEVFTNTDDFGLPEHINDEDTTTVNTAAGLRTTENPTAGVPHQSIIDAYLCVPKGGVQLQHTGGGQHTSAAYISNCTGPLSLSTTIEAVVASKDMGYYPEGIYRVRLYSHDDGTFGTARFRWRLQTGGYVDVPADAFTTTMPRVESIKVFYDKDAGTLTDIQTGEDIPLTTTGLTFCNPCGNEIPVTTFSTEDASDIEATTVELCDIGNDNKPYLLHTYYNTVDATSTTATTELDGITAYAPTTPGGYKPTRCFMTEAYIIDTAGIPNGGNEQFWSTPGGAIDAGPGAPIEESFRERDACGVLKHENNPDIEQIVTTDGAANTDPVDPAGTAPHQSRMDTYLVVPKGGAELFYGSVGAHSSLVYGASCGDKLEVIGGTNSSEIINLGYYPQGVYHFVWFVHDDGGSGRGRLQWVINGANRATIPIANLYTELPNITKCTAIYDKDLNTLTDIISGDDIPMTTDGLMFCDPCENKVEGGVAESSAKDASRVIGRERIVMANGDEVNLTPPVDLNGRVLANGAIVQVQYSDASDIRDQDCVRYRVDGGAATAVVGFLAGHKEYIELGCATSNGATITDDALEVSNFSLHTGQTDGQVVLEVLYYAY